MLEISEETCKTVVAVHTHGVDHVLLCIDRESLKVVRFTLGEPLHRHQAVTGTTEELCAWVEQEFGIDKWTSDTGFTIDAVDADFLETEIGLHILEHDGFYYIGKRPK